MKAYPCAQALLSSSVRILTIANHLGSRGGLERTQLTNCRTLAARGHSVEVIYASAGDFTEEWRAFADEMVEIRGTLPRRREPWSSMSAVLSALRTARRMHPDIVYVYRYWDIPFAAATAAGTVGRLVYHVCLPPPSRVPVWLRAGLARVEAALAVSEDTARRWRGTGLATQLTSVVLTGIDLVAYSPSSADARAHTREELGIDKDAFLVVYAGRIGREKGVDVLLRAFNMLDRDAGNRHLLVVGSPSLGADPADSKRFVAELEESAKGSHVTWLPGRADVVPIIQSADVAVVASLWPEPLARSVMEPLACGVPVVATRTGGNPELLTGRFAEYLVEPGDDEGLASKLASLEGWRLRDPDLSNRCRAFAEERFSVDREVAAIESAMADLLVGARGRSARRGRALRGGGAKDSGGRSGDQPASAL